MHNEGSGIKRDVERFVAGLSGELRSALVEILLVENGSTDNTPFECGKLEGSFPGLVRVITIGRGSYGEAIRQGILQAGGDCLSILECDALDAGFVERSRRVFAAEKPQLIVASKRHPLSIDGRPLNRRLLTAGFNLMLRVASGYPGTDTHGLKTLETDWGRKICSIALTTDELFQTELVLLGWRLGGKIVELPVRIEERRTPPVSILRRLPKVFRVAREIRRSIRRFPQGSENAVRVMSGD